MGSCVRKTTPYEGCPRRCSMRGSFNLLFFRIDAGQDVSREETRMPLVLSSRGRDGHIVLEAGGAGKIILLP